MDRPFLRSQPTRDRGDLVRVMGIDPGAERMGWAVLDVPERGDLVYVDSGILANPRGKKGFQPYRLDLERDLVARVPLLLDQYNPDEIITETVPAVGGGNFVAATQSYLVNVALTIVHAFAILRGTPVRQIAANTVQSRWHVKGRGKKITKVAVRNAVIDYFPQLAARKKDWIKVFEEPDSVAIAAVGSGYRHIK